MVIEGGQLLNTYWIGTVANWRRPAWHDGISDSLGFGPRPCFRSIWIRTGVAQKPTGGDQLGMATRTELVLLGSDDVGSLASGSSSV